MSRASTKRGRWPWYVKTEPLWSGLRPAGSITGTRAAAAAVANEEAAQSAAGRMSANEGGRGAEEGAGAAGEMQADVNGEVSVDSVQLEVDWLNRRTVDGSV